MDQSGSRALDIESRWHAHPTLSAAVRAIAVLTPAVTAFAFSWMASQVVPPPDAAGPRIWWWVVLGALSLLVLIAVQRLARRLLPLQHCSTSPCSFLIRLRPDTNSHGR